MLLFLVFLLIGLWLFGMVTGSGLGLTIARDLVVAHGGTIDAESRVGAGTTVSLTLPAHS